ncbi:nematocyst expressed protein 3-like [Dermacentor albipictus]|uniref:nematocyst expressed protein 3-like n=1 Tax=Dermacentor albipictus TaxID=60249 RepID=UPI0031FD41CB
MDTFIKSFVVCACFSFLLSLAHAFDDEFEKKWKKHRTALPPATIFIIFVAVTVAAGCISILCACLRRQHSLYNASPRIPPPLAPAAPVVTSGARMHSPLEAYPLVSGGAPSPPAMSYPQQTYHPQPTAPFPQEGPCMGDYAAPLVQPSAAPLPSPYAPFDPPPPYVLVTDL